MSHSNSLRLLLFAPLILSGCAHHAYVSCGNLSCYQGPIGVLNTPQFNIGTVVGLNTKTKGTFFIRAVAVPKDLVSQTGTIGSTSESFNSQLSISFDATIPKTVQADAQAKIQQSSVLTVSNYSRQTLMDPIDYLNKVDGLGEQLAKLSKPNIHFLFVIGLIPADKVILEAHDNTNVSAKANVIKVGNFSIDVSYACNDELSRVTNQAGAFFKYDFVAVDSSNHITQDTDFTAQLAAYDWSPSFRMRVLRP